MSIATLAAAHAELVAKAVAAERERCAKIVENALRDDFKAKTGHGRELSEAELFFSKLIRAG